MALVEHHMCPALRINHSIPDPAFLAPRLRIKPLSSYSSHSRVGHPSSTKWLALASLARKEWVVRRTVALGEVTTAAKLERLGGRKWYVQIGVMLLPQRVGMVVMALQ